MFRGGPGLGKSRLAAAAEDLARNSGEPVLRLSGSPLPTAACLHPIRGLVDESALPQHPDDVSPATVDAIVDRVLAHFGDRAGVLIVEDVHWLDPATLRVLDAVLSNTRGRLLVVLTGRAGLALPAAWPVKVCDLQPMTEAETDALVKALAPELPEAVANRGARAQRRRPALHRADRGRDRAVSAPNRASRHRRRFRTRSTTRS